MKKIFTSFIAFLVTTLCAVAQLPYNTTMTGDHYNNAATIVQSSGNNAWENGIRLGEVNKGGFNYDDKYVVVALSNNGVAKKIACTTEAKSVQETIFPPTDIVFYIAWSADKSEFTTLETKNSKTNSFDVALPKEAKYIKLCYSGNFGGYFRDIVVEELVYCNAPEHNLWEPTDSIGAEPMVGETTIEWCNTEAFTATLTGDGASQFAVSIANNACKGKYGTAIISVTYNNEVAGVHEALLTLENGTYSYTITLRGTTLAEPDPIAQEIIWEQELDTVNVLDTVVLTATAMTELTYAVSDSTIASVDGNTLVLHTAGEVLVYAYAAESDVYLADTLVKAIVVSALKQEVIWVQDFTAVHALDTIELTATAHTNVTYSVSDATIASVEGNMIVFHQSGEVVVYAYAAENNIYSADTIAKTIVVSKLEQTIELEQNYYAINVGDTLLLDGLAQATSGLELNYQLSTEGLAVIEENLLIAQSVGTLVVVVSQTGNELYAPASDVEIEILIQPQVSTNCESITTDQVEVRKVIRNGQIYIFRGDHIFDALGNMIM